MKKICETIGKNHSSIFFTSLLVMLLASSKSCELNQEYEFGGNNEVPLHVVQKCLLYDTNLLPCIDLVRCL
jgi:hypothetical protein